MRTFAVWATYLAAVFVGGALLAPWAYHGAQAAAGVWPALQDLAGEPFHRYVHRCMLGLALAGLWPATRLLGLRSARALGLGGPRSRWLREAACGLAAGFLSLALIAAAAMALGGREWDAPESLAKLLGDIAGATLAAAVVAALEETLFRGAVFGSLRKKLSFVPALCLSSAVYAWAHFFARARWEERVDALAGLAVLRGMLSGLTNVQALLPGFLTLTLAGALLAWGYERTGRLAFSMGLHAGWIFWLKAYGALTDPAPGGSAFWWGSGKLVDGWAAFLALAALAACLPRILKKCPENASSKEPGG